MRALLIVVVLAVLVGAVVLTGMLVAAHATRQRLQRRAHVVAGRDSRVPVAWAGAHTRPARLFRRLRDAAASVAAAIPDEPASAGQATRARERATLEDLACQVADRLVVADASSTDQRERLLDLVEQQVVRVERAAEAIVASAVAGDQVGSVDDAAERLDALAQARAEVEQVAQRAARG